MLGMEINKKIVLQLVLWQDKIIRPRMLLLWVLMQEIQIKVMRQYRLGIKRVKQIKND